jgi:type I restriction enzyme R subunit
VTSNFDFLQTEWPDFYQSAVKVEALVHTDARTAGFQARRVLETLVRWLYTHDRALVLPYDDKLDSLLRAPSFREVVGEARVAKADLLRRLGNQAVHSAKPFRAYDALMMAQELFHLLFWLARTYGTGSKPDDALRFDPALLPQETAVPARTLEQLQRLDAELRGKAGTRRGAATSAGRSGDGQGGQHHAGG